MGFTKVIDNVKVYVDYETDIDNKIVITGVEAWEDNIIDIIDPKYMEELEAVCRIDREEREEEGNEY